MLPNFPYKVFFLAANYRTPTHNLLSQILFGIEQNLEMELKYLASAAWSRGRSGLDHCGRRIATLHVSYSCAHIC